MTSRRRWFPGLFLLAACAVPIATGGAGGCANGEPGYAGGSEGGPDGAAAADAPAVLPEAGGEDAPSSPEDAEIDAPSPVVEAGADANSADGSAKDAGNDGESGDAEAVGEGGKDAAGGDAEGDATAGPGNDSGTDAGLDSGSDTGSDDSGTDSGTDSGGVCDPVSQVGCPAADKCTIDPPTCVPNGTVANGGACGPVDDCAAGGLCTNDGTQAICREICEADANCKQAAVPSGSTSEPNNVAHCVIDITGTTSTVCTFACNPVTKAGASGCPAGMACTYGGTASIPELTDCENVGAAAEGAVCTTAAGCGAGLVCVSNGTASHCREVCRNATPGDCTVAGDTCFAPSGLTSPMFGFCCSAGGGC